MVRFLNKKRKKRGTCVYLIAAEWFNTWRLYADYEVRSSLGERDYNTSVLYQIPDHPLERLRQFQPLSHTAKQSSRSQASTYSGRSPRRSHPDNICPKVEVAPAPGNGSVVEVTRGVVLVEGEEDEEYSHVITTEPVTSAGEGMSTSLSSPTFCFACIILHCLYHLFTQSAYQLLPLPLPLLLVTRAMIELFSILSTTDRYSRQKLDTSKRFVKNHSFNTLIHSLSLSLRLFHSPTREVASPEIKN